MLDGGWSCGSAGCWSFLASVDASIGSLQLAAYKLQPTQYSVRENALCECASCLACCGASIAHVNMWAPLTAVASASTSTSLVARKLFRSGHLCQQFTYTSSRHLVFLQAALLAIQSHPRLKVSIDLPISSFCTYNDFLAQSQTVLEYKRTSISYCIFFSRSPTQRIAPDPSTSLASLSVASCTSVSQPRRHG